jgi:hypothetical protein
MAPRYKALAQGLTRGQCWMTRFGKSTFLGRNAGEGRQMILQEPEPSILPPMEFMVAIEVHRLRLDVQQAACYRGSMSSRREASQASPWNSHAHASRTCQGWMNPCQRKSSQTPGNLCRRLSIKLYLTGRILRLGHFENGQGFNVLIHPDIRGRRNNREGPR